MVEIPECAVHLSRCVQGRACAAADHRTRRCRYAELVKAAMPNQGAALRFLCQQRPRLFKASKLGDAVQFGRDVALRALLEPHLA